MNILLQECLNPLKHAENEKIILQQLQNETKIQEFKNLLLENNNLAFIFLKTSAKKLLDSVFTKSIIQNSEFLLNCIKNTQKINYNMFCSFFEILSLHYVCDCSFYTKIKDILESSNVDSECILRIYGLLSVCFKKYEMQTRSNDLYTEINSNVGLFGELILYNLQNMVYLPETLQIYYYLIFQDIPTYFEERSEMLNVVLNKTYRICNSIDMKPTSATYQLSSNTITKILILYLTKYTECCNQEMLLNNIIDVLIYKDNITQDEVFILLQFIKRRVVVKIQDVYNILYKLCHIENKTDPLEYTRNVDKIEDDPDRKEISDAINILDEIQPFNTQFINFGTKEGDIFFFCVLKYDNKIIEILEQYKNKQVNLNDFSIFTIYRYLKEQKLKYDLNFTFGLLLKFDFAYYKLCDYINTRIEEILNDKETKTKKHVDIHGTKDTNNNNSLDKYYIDGNEEYNSLVNICSDQNLDAIIKYKITQIDDEFTSKYLFYCNIVNKSLNNNLFEYACKIINQPEHVSNFVSYFHLVNTALFYVDNNYCKNHIYKLAYNIFVKEATDLYSIAIQVFAILVKHNYFDNLFLSVFSNEKLWSVQDLQIPLSMLSIELYKTNRIDTSVMENLVYFLVQHNLFCTFLILEQYILQVDNEQGFKLLMNVSTKALDDLQTMKRKLNNSCYVYEGILCVLAKLQIEDEKLNVAVQKCVEELLTKVVNKRNITKLRKALNILKVRVNENVKHKIENLLQRNSTRICENGYVLFLIKKEYDLQ